MPIHYEDVCELCADLLTDFCPSCQDLEPSDCKRGRCGVVILKCGHIFHIHCLKEFRENRETCPLCKTPIVVNKKFRPSCSEIVYPDLTEKLMEYLLQLQPSQYSELIETEESEFSDFLAQLKKDERAIFEREQRRLTEGHTGQRRDILQQQASERRGLREQLRILQREAYGTRLPAELTKHEMDKIIESFEDNIARRLKKTLATFYLDLRRTLDNTVWSSLTEEIIDEYKSIVSRKAKKTRADLIQDATDAIFKVLRLHGIKTPDK